MNSRLEADIGETKTMCPYAENCPILTGLARINAEEPEEMYVAICSTDRRYGCSHHVLMGARE